MDGKSLRGTFARTGGAGVHLLAGITHTTGTHRAHAALGLTNLPTELAHPARIATHVRNHWHIENRLHWVRDVTFHEDHSRVRTGNAPRVMASPCNLAISALRRHGWNNTAKQRPDRMPRTPPSPRIRHPPEIFPQIGHPIGHEHRLRARPDTRGQSIERGRDQAGFRHGHGSPTIMRHQQSHDVKGRPSASSAPEDGGKVAAAERD
ncbi:DDE family transposase [Actinokineospora auranticolor]|uniref:DDE family transposase n=1 Tax=Actinokineospora auranticolor TaxID=155976 RepID=A0A2S6GKS0_9PSEU|nr:DDE family transposase [Actinokineospora auranticolor]